jgi:sugar phosphate isomerase/epimerase
VPQTSTDLHRRGLRAAGLGLAVTGGSASAASRPFFQQKKLPIGIQLYTLAPEIAKDLDGTLAAVAAMGYRAVEFPGFLGRSGADIRKALDKVGLTCASAHIQPRAVGPDGGLDGDLNALADKLAAIGVKTAVAPILRVPDRYLTSPTPGGVGGLLRRLAVELTADDWKMNADFLNGVGKTLKARGLQVGYHNHNFEFAPVGDTNGLEILLKNTDPDLVTFEIDGCGPPAPIRSRSCAATRAASPPCT